MHSNASFSSKIASTSTLLILLLSALTVALAFAPAVHAAGPTLTLSTSSGSPGLGTQDGNIGTVDFAATSVYVTGTGFPSGQTNILIGLVPPSTTISSSTVTTNCMAIARTSIIGSGTITCIGNYGSSSGTYYVTADANGYFEARFYVPTEKSGAYSVVALYTPTGGVPTLSPAVTFNIVPIVSVIAVNSGVSSGIFDTCVAVLFAGFQGGESVTILPINFISNSREGVGISSLTADSSGSSEGLGTSTSTVASCTSSNLASGGGVEGFIANRPGGSISITAIGTSSSLSASSTFTINPSLEFEEFPQGTTYFSIPSAAGAAFFLGWNFGNKATTTSNALTLDGQTTITPAITTAASGQFNAQKFTYTSALTEGVVTVTFNGTSYSFGAGNIVATPPLASADLTETTDVAPIEPLLASTATTGPAFFTMDSSAYIVSATSFINIFAVGGSPNGVAVTASYQINGTGSFSGQTIYGTSTASGGTDPYGGWYGYIFAPASYGSANVLQLGGDTGLAAAPSDTVAITPWISTASGNLGASGTHLNYGSTPTLVISGFKPDSVLTVTVGGVVWGSPLSPTWTNGGYTTTLVGMPDAPGPTATVTVSGSTSGNTASVSKTIYPVVQTGALGVTSANAGQTVTLSSGTSTGVHGLAANTAYTLMFDGPPGTSAGTFTSTASGTLPPGVQFMVPLAAASGTHIIDIETGGASALYTHTASSSTQQYNNLLLSVSSLGTAVPSAGGVGASVALSAQGLKPNTAYTVQLATGVSYTSFTSTASGAVPSGTSFVFPATCTSASSVVAGSSSCTTSTTSYGELGTSYGIYFVGPNEAVGSSTAPPDASGTFLLQASANENMTSAPAGHPFIYNGLGLYPSTSYNVVWNAALTSQGLTSGQIVGAFTTNNVGSGSATLTAPTTAAPGTYTVSLMKSTDSLGSSSGKFILVNPPTMTVGGVSGTLGTTTLTSSGAPTKTVINGQATITGSFTNTASSSISVYMWVSVQNSAGQTVGVFLGSATIASGGTTSIGAALFNLPSGTYTATVFCTTTNGVVVSTTSTTSSFSV